MAGSWNIQAACQALTNNSGPSSKHQCAKYVRTAMEAGGMSTAGRPVAAKDYVNFLPKIGFTGLGSIHGKANQAAWTQSNAQMGDIAVMDHGQYGHICMWNGSQWISDFRQNNMWVYGGDGTCNLYRFGGAVDGSLSPIMSCGTGAGFCGGLGGAVTLVYDVPLEKQQDHILFTELANVKYNLLKEILESEGIIFGSGQLAKFNHVLDLRLKKGATDTERLIKAYQPKNTAYLKYANHISNDDSAIVQSIIDNPTQFNIITPEMTGGDMIDLSGVTPGNITVSGNAAANKQAFGAVLQKFSSALGLNQLGMCLIMGQVMHESGNFKYMAEIGAGKGRKYGVPDGPYGQIYYGRGPVQVTWYSNYKKIYEDFFVPNGLGQYNVVQNADLGLDPTIGSLLTLGWFLTTSNGKRAREAANRGDVLACTKAINGGTNGLADRKSKTLALCPEYGINPSQLIS